MTREPLPSWLETCGEAAAQIGELLARLEQPFTDMADDEEPDQVRVVACLTEARAILTHEWTHRVPAGLIGLGVNHARRIVLDAGLTVPPGPPGRCAPCAPARARQLGRDPYNPRGGQLPEPRRRGRSRRGRTRQPQARRQPAVNDLQKRQPGGTADFRFQLPRARVCC